MEVLILQLVLGLLDVWHEIVWVVSLLQEVIGTILWDVGNALSVEALTYRDGIDLANILNFQRVTVKTNCHNLVQLWEAHQHYRSEIMGILHQTQEIASQLHCNLIFVRREANFASHLCVQQASRERV